MLIFGHLGFARLLAEPFRRQRPLSLLLAGSLLPDIIDKLVFYVSDFSPGTRAVGHTLLFATFIACAEKSRSKKWMRCPLAFGISTHLICDYVGDFFAMPSSYARNLKILLWPALGKTFPPTTHLNFVQQATRVTEPYYLATEMIGISILIFFAWYYKRGS